MTTLPKLTLALAALTLGLGLTVARPVIAETEGPFKSEKATFQLVTVASGLAHPWGLAFLPDGGMLVTEREGGLRHVTAQGTLLPDPVEGAPDAESVGQGGLLDVALHPDFAANRLVYFTYTKRGDGGWGTAVARARWTGSSLENLQDIWVMEPMTRGGRHFGSRLAFAPDGKLHVSLGDRGDRPRAQKTDDPAGSTLRLNDDGSIPADNPFLGQTGHLPELFTVGNRNVQGMTVHPTTGAVWSHEHGPRGGDEVNILRAGENYGWPVVTYGRAYSGFSIGEGTSKPGITEPVKYWVPSIAPSGMAFYTGDKLTGWQGSLFVGALALTHLNRLTLDGDRVVGEERLLDDWGERIRDVRNGPDGYLYILTDDPEGRVLRLEPVN
ncbi:MAG: PQQ-dependent sugar dehydrogenase [Magnetovibrionaceae bacterium]